MPHLIVEYTDNLVDMPQAPLLDALNATIVATGQVQKETDLKSRLVRTEQYVIGTDPTASRGFVHAELRLLAGRTPEVKKELSDRIAAVLRAEVPHPAGVMVQLSAEIADMDKASYYKDRL